MEEKVYWFDRPQNERDAIDTQAYAFITAYNKVAEKEDNHDKDQPNT